MGEFLFVALGAVAVAAGLAARRRVRAARQTVDEELVERIEFLGEVDADDVEPLDLAHAAEEEDEFWHQTWDEPERL